MCVDVVVKHKPGALSAYALEQVTENMKTIVCRFMSVANMLVTPNEVILQVEEDEMQRQDALLSVDVRAKTCRTRASNLRERAWAIRKDVEKIVGNNIPIVVNIGLEGGTGLRRSSRS